MANRQFSGGTQADSEIYVQLQSALYRYCLSLTKSNWDAADLAQSAWEKAIIRWRRADHPNKEALLLRIARNIWIDHMRRAASLKRIVLKLKREEMAVAEQMDEGIGCELMFQALLQHLTPRQLAAFLLCDVFQYSSQESAKLLCTTEGALKAALHRARRALREVREDLMADRLTQKHNDGEKQLLQMMAAYYQAGDIEALVQLVKQDELDAVVAFAAIQSRVAAKKQAPVRLIEERKAMLAA